MHKKGDEVEVIRGWRGNSAGGPGWLIGIIVQQCQTRGGPDWAYAHAHDGLSTQKL
jgi:hypothetical protein